MRTIDVHWPRPNSARIIDVTPLPWWRRVGRIVAGVLLFVVVVPVFWLLGSLLALLLLGAAAAILLAGGIQVWRLERASRRASGARPASTADAIDPE